MKKIASLLLLVLVAGSVADENRNRVATLDRSWRFTTENDKKFSEPSFDDSDWDVIYVSESWEDEGYPGYDGYAWYRSTFTLDPELSSESLQLDLGFIDDVDRVWINGKLVGGKGSFPPDYVTAYDVHRIYPLPNELVDFDGENIIAVQVYDEWGNGGIVSGRPGIYSITTLPLAVNLAGAWKFETGDDKDWAESNLNDSEWEDVIAPGAWEEQGYPGYDGYAWYRKEVVIPADLADEKLILVLGKIDDIDEVYLNGERVGRTGEFPAEKYLDRNNSYYNQDRYYYVKSEMIRFGKKNTIAIRVYDVWNVGGIYEGPLGITTRHDYVTYRREMNRASNIVEEILNEIF